MESNLNSKSGGITLASMKWDEYTFQLAATNKLTLGKTALEEINRLGDTCHFIKGQLIFDTGDKSNHIYLIEKGWLNINRLAVNGRQITVAIRKVGDVIGLAEALYGGKRTCSAEVMENLTAVSITSKDFKEIMSKNPDLAVRVSEVLGERLREAHSLIHEIASLSAPARVALLLMKLAEEQNETLKDCIRLNLKLTHEEIARMVGTSRQTISTILSEFKQDGSIVYKGRAIDIICPPKLVKWIT